MSLKDGRIEPIFTGAPPLPADMLAKSNSTEANRTGDDARMPSAHGSEDVHRRRATQFPVGRATFECSDRWTIVTLDGSNAAQWEQTIVVTDNGAEVTTQHAPGQFEG